MSRGWENRWRSPTPRFFRKLQNTGLMISAVGSLLMAYPEILPETLVVSGGYLLVAGGIISAVSQLTVEETADHPENGFKERSP